MVERLPIAVFVLPTTSRYNPRVCPNGEEAGYASTLPVDVHTLTTTSDDQARTRTAPGAPRNVVQGVSGAVRPTNPPSRSPRGRDPRQERQDAEPRRDHPRADR